MQRLFEFLLTASNMVYHLIAFVIDSLHLNIVKIESLLYIRLICQTHLDQEKKTKLNSQRSSEHQRSSLWKI